MKPTFRPPYPPQSKPPSWGSTPDPPYPKPNPQPKPPSWGSTTDKPYTKPPVTDWVPYPPGVDDDQLPPATDDWPWGPIFPGKASKKSKASKWMKGSWGTGSKGGKNGCIHLSKAGKSWWQPSSWGGGDDVYAWNGSSKGSSDMYDDVIYRNNPCVGNDDDQVGGKSGKGSHSSTGYSSIKDFQSMVLKNSSERIRPHRVGLSLVLLYCLSTLL